MRVERIDDARVQQFPTRDRVQTVMLPPVLGFAVDLGVLLSLVAVLSAWGPAGLIAGIAVGTLAIAGIITFAVLRLAGRGQTLPPASGLTYARVRVRSWEPDAQSRQDR